MTEVKMVKMQDVEDARARKMAQGIVEEIEGCGGNMSMMWRVLGNLISYSRQMEEIGIVKMDYIYNKRPDAFEEARTTLR